MSIVAVPWLALQLSEPGAAGPLVGVAVAAYVLPGAAGAVLLNRWLRRLPPGRLIQMNAWIRASFLCWVPIAWMFNLLHPALFIGLLAGSAVLHAWGGAARFALVAQLLPADQRLAANAMLSTSMWLSRITGPALAGALTVLAGPAWIIGLDALTFVVIAVQTGRVVAPGVREPQSSPLEAKPGEVLDALRAKRELLVLLVVAWLFNVAYGPIPVALPLFVSDALGGGADLLGLYWAAFGLGAVAGALAAGAMRRLPLWPVLLGIIAGHGVAMLPFGSPAPAVVSLAGFGLAGVVYGPYNALTFTLFQAATPTRLLTTVLALRTALLLTATPLGAIVAGPLTTLLGARQTLVLAGVAMIAVAAGAATLRRRFRPAGAPAPDGR